MVALGDIRASDPRASVPNPTCPKLYTDCIGLMHNEVTRRNRATSRFMRLAGVNVQHPIQGINITSHIHVASKADTRAAAAD